ncbi:MAG: lipid A deacylase LpxR family protein [Pseudomonadota bacterium]
MFGVATAVVLGFGFADRLRAETPTEAAESSGGRNFDGARSEDDFAARGFGIDPRTGVNLVFDNDLIGGTGDDRQYTSGVFLKILLPADATPWLETELADKFLGRSPRRLELTFGQMIFTPDDLNERDPIPDDRPYGAFLFVGAEATTLKPNRRLGGVEGLVEDRVGLQLGVIGGVGALGEFSQDVSRSFAGGPKPEGYENGLETEPGLQIAAARAFRIYGDAFGLDTEIKPFGEVAAGNVVTQGTLGLTLRIGDDLHYDQSRLDYRTGSSSGGWFGPVDGGAWGVEVGAQARAVGFNVFLDGNTFSGGPDADIDIDREPLVLDAHWGVTYATRRFRAGYAMVWRSNEFEEQDEETIFGTLSLGVKF